MESKRCKYCGNIARVYECTDWGDKSKFHRIQCECCQYLANELYPNKFKTREEAEKLLDSMPEYVPQMITIDIKALYYRIKSNEGFYSTDSNLHSWPEDYIEDRTDWDSLQSNCNSMYYLLDDIVDLYDKNK